ncbi:MAG: virulence RhuM family protein [Candidatus Paceibacterota bacterium]
MTEKKPPGEIVVYTTPDDKIEVQLKIVEQTAWLTQLEMTELFQTSKQNISLHINNIFDEGELEPDSVVKEYLTTAADGKKYSTKHYNLDVILAVGYRVRSERGTQFRKWATTTLREYLVKGFVMNDERLKDPGGWDYFDELLERIRDIRASEKRFYQKVKDIYALSTDYDPKSNSAQLFFKKVQNKMLWAVTGNTAAELIAGRSDPEKLNMGLTSWKGDKVRKQDIDTAKNYLKEEEIKELNRIVTMYLDFAEDQAQRRNVMYMKDWEERLDAFLEFNERDVLEHAGKLRSKVAKSLAAERYEEFDIKRRQLEAAKADEETIKKLKQIEQNAKRKKK